MTDCHFRDEKIDMRIYNSCCSVRMSIHLLKMHYFTYFNRTDAELLGYWNVCKALLIIEIIMVLMCHVCYTLIVYLSVKTMWNQKNMRNVWAVCTAQYLPSTFDRAVQAGLTVFALDNDSGGHPSTAFMITSYIRAFCLYLVYYCLPAVVLERCFATYFLDDYERKPRTYIGYFIIMSLLVIATWSSYMYHTGTSTIYHFAFVMILNTVGILGNMVNYRLNMRYYKDTMNPKKPGRAYSLGGRYQVAENIRASRFVFYTVLWVGLLNMTSTLSLIVDNFNVTMFWRNMAVLSFNYSVLVYGIVIPVVMYWHNEKWKAELKYLLTKFRTTGKPKLDFISVKSTLGAETHVEPQLHAGLYFDMLRKDWS